METNQFKDDVHCYCTSFKELNYAANLCSTQRHTDNVSVMESENRNIH